MLGGSDSSLSGAGKYSLAKSLFGSTVGSAMQGDTKAISSLSQATNDFLAVSKANASSQFEYLLDFNDVLNQTETLESSLTGQLSVAEMQLSALNSVAKSLGVIVENTKVSNLETILSTYFGGSGMEYFNSNSDLQAAWVNNDQGVQQRFGNSKEFALYHYAMYGGKENRPFTQSSGSLLGSSPAGSLIAPEITPMQTSNQVQTVTSSNVSALVEQHLSDVRFEIRAVAFNTEKMAKILDRVTQDKTSVSVTIAA